MSLETVYHKMPVLVQHAACSVAGWRMQRVRFGLGFRADLRRAEERMTWPEDRLLAERDRRLARFVQHCAATVPYYGRLFRELGIDPQRIRTLEDLKQLPVLSKEEVRGCLPQLASTAVPARRRMTVNTSGSTGSALRFAWTREAYRQQGVVWWRFRRWHGIRPGTWCGVFAGRQVMPLRQQSPPFWRYDLPGRQIFFSGHHLSPQNLPAYVAELRRRRPPWIHGYPSMLALVAAHLLETGSKLGYRLRHVTTGSETLLPQQSRLIEEALGARPRQHYGMVEAVACFSECDAGSLHVDEDYAATEFIPQADGPEVEGAGYRVVGTNLSNLATPLLRYDVQDMVTLSPGRCRCGRPGRIVGSIDGRVEDYIVLKNGARLGRVSRIVWGLHNVREVQIRQQQVGQIILCVVRHGGYADVDEQNLLQAARRLLGDDTAIVVRYVDSLPRSKTGKLRFVVSELEEGRLTGVTNR